MVRRIINSVTAADEGISREDAIQEAISSLKDDFDYLVDGIDKLTRSGRLDTAQEAITSAGEAIQEALELIASTIAE